MTLVVAIIGLVFLILIHEAGHFFVALAVGMRPRKFYLGFGPPLVRTFRNGIEYGVAAIPAGGYVKIPGMHRPAARDLQVNLEPAMREAPELARPARQVERALAVGDEDGARAALPDLERAVGEAGLTRFSRKSAERGIRELADSLSPEAYWRQRTWKRIAVIAAGPGVNVLFAIALLAAVYMLGVPSANTRTVSSVEGGRPAAVAGLEKGDVIVGVGGHATPTFEAVRRQIQASGGRPITVTVERGGVPVTLGPVQPVRDTTGGKRWILGFLPGVSFKHYSAGSAFRLAADDCWQATKGMGLAIAGLFHQRSRGQLTSAVGIARVSSDALKVSFRYYLQILGLVSLSLALLNLLPLLPLDGGHILFSAIEGIRRRAVAREVYERASVIGFALILIVAFIALSNDLGGSGPG